MAITLEGFKDVMELLKGLFSGLKSATGLASADRIEMRDALADTVEIIDQSLTILKKHLAMLLSELKFGDEDKARSMIADLGDFKRWEVHYRQLLVYGAIHTSLEHMQQSGIFTLQHRISPADGTAIIYQNIYDYIGGETSADRSAGRMLKHISAMADTARYSRDQMISTLEGAQKMVLKWQQKFIELEQQMRSAA